MMTHKINPNVILTMVDVFQNMEKIFQNVQEIFLDDYGKKYLAIKDYRDQKTELLRGLDYILEEAEKGTLN